MNDRIELEPGRLALRKPELGPLLIVTVTRAISDEEVVVDGKWHAKAENYLPILRSGDVVPEGSLLLDVNTSKTLEMWETGADMEPVEAQGVLYETTMYALLRYGAENG